jgi:hypothetical protein
MNKSKFYKLLILEIIALSLLCAYFFIDSSNIYRWYAGSTTFVKQDVNCNLHNTPCKVVLKDGSTVTLSIYPKNIPLMKPLKFSVKAKGIKLGKLQLKIFAINMNMGLTKTTLIKIKPNLFEGNVTLASCVKGGMKWEANIIANKFQKSLGATFKFKTK